MADFYLNPDSWDIEFTSSGDIEIIEGPRETNQNSKFRLQIIQGEMFDDTRQGMPWLTDMVNPAIDISAKKRIMERVILSTPGAISIDSMEIGVDANGLATAQWAGTCSTGESFSGTMSDTTTDTSDGSLSIYEQSVMLESSARAWELAGIYYGVR
ncbi:MAG: hypothetical protein ACRCXB_20025 [Aeromonadaceae bacterium]